MRSTLMAVLAMCAFAGAPACKKTEKKQAAVEPKPAEPMPAPAPPPPPEPVAEKAPEPPDDMLNNMKNCPNAVAGAESKVAANKAAVSVTVTAKDEAASAEIRTRAHQLLDEAAPAAGEVKHTGSRTGGGALGKCPVVIPGATAKVEDVKGGVKITLTPVAPKKLAEIVPLVNDRLNAMPKGDQMDGAKGAAEGGGAKGAAAEGAPAGEGGAGAATPGDTGKKGAEAEAPEGGAAAASGKGAKKAAAEDKAEHGK